MALRYYSSTAQETTLMTPVTGSTTVISVASTTGFPGTTPFTLALDYESATNELVDVTLIAGTNLTVTRGVDGTSATSHNAGARVRHVTSARDETDSRNHENASANIHGLAPGDTIVGTLATQTLHNKTLDKATGDLKRIDIFNGPGWTTTVIGDSTDPTRSKFFVIDNEINLDVLGHFAAKGQLNLNMRSDFTTNDVAFAVNTRLPTAGDKLAIRAASTDGAVFTVGDDGRVRVNQVGNFGSVLDIKSSATNASPLQQWLDSAATQMVAVASDGRVLSHKGMTIDGAQGTGFIILNVQGLAGQTANLQEWRNSAATTLASVDPSGNASFKALTGTSLTSNGTTTLNGNTSVVGSFTVNGPGSKTYAIKSATTARASTTVLANDPHLVLSLAANATYELSGFLEYNGQPTAGADFKMDWTIPAGSTLQYARNGYISNSVTQTDQVVTDEATIRVLGTFGTTTNVSANIKGVLVTGGTSGNIQLRWAQNVSNAIATSLLINSFIKLERIA
ncbi:MAG TPA: hypothetical protein VIY48_19285 [Candidatus Paceibacterota bacterium]